MASNLPAHAESRPREALRKTGKPFSAAEIGGAVVSGIAAGFVFADLAVAAGAAVGGGAVGWLIRFGNHYRKVPMERLAQAESIRDEALAQVQELEARRPRIDVTITFWKDTDNLEVYNDGAAALFTAQIEVLEGHSNQVKTGTILTGRWTETGTDGQPIMQGHRGHLMVRGLRLQRGPGPTAAFVVMGYDLRKGGAQNLVSNSYIAGTYMNPPGATIRVTISSEPEMERPWVGCFRLSLRNLDWVECP